MVDHLYLVIVPDGCISLLGQRLCHGAAEVSPWVKPLTSQIAAMLDLVAIYETPVTSISVRQYCLCFYIYPLPNSQHSR